MNIPLSFDQALKKKSFFYISKDFKARPSLSFSFLRYLFLYPFLKIIYFLYRWNEPITPNVPVKALELIRAFIKKESKGFEYGMGKSTIFFGRESDFIHSVSTSETWVEEMEKRIEKYNIKHVKLHFTPVKTTKIETIESFYPPQVRIPSYRSGICRKYWAFIQSIDRFNDESLDFVFIQDKARIECLIKSRNKVRSGGMIIFKDSDKKRYSSIMQIMRDWQKVDTFSGFSKTTIWIKP